MPQRSALPRSPCSSRPSVQSGALARAIALISCLIAFEARAAEPARLEWVRLEGAGSCIDRAELEARVTRRLGSKPFDPRASRSIEGVVRRTGEVWRAQIAVRARANEANPPLRELESAAADCTSLGNAVVLAVALAVDPAAAFSDAAAKTPPPPAPVEAPAPPPPAPPHAVSEATLAGRADVALIGQLGLLPKASLGVGLGMATTLTPRFELGLHARAFPEVEVGGDPSYAVGLAALTLDVCALARPAQWVDLRACAGPSLGLLHATVLVGDRDQPGERGSLAAELGFDAVFGLTRALTFELGARAAMPVTRYRFTLEGSDQALFVQSVVSGIAQVGLGLHFGAR
jgi:hypothetical protein